MQSRTFYFLQDSVTGNFYTGENNTIEDLSTAAVYFQSKNAEKKIKDIICSWEHQDEYADHWIKLKKSESKEEKAWAKKEKQDVISRKNLENWGIKIVSKKVNI